MHFDVMVNFKHTRTLDYCIINVNCIRFYIIVIKIVSVEPRQWRSWLRVRPASGRLGVRILAATDLSRKTGSDSSTAIRSAVGVSVTGPRRWPL